MSRKFEYVKRIENKDFDLPKRSTKQSAGYDFFNPEEVTLNPKEIVYVKTGVKAYMLRNEMLILANRSSNPKKKGLVLINRDWRCGLRFCR
jgi:dUTP pyrophosphatase